MDPLERHIQFLLSLRGRSPQADAYSRRELFRLSARYAIGGSALAMILAACGNSQTTPTATSGSAGSGTSSPGASSPAAEIELPMMKPEDVPEKLKGSGEVVAISFGGAYQAAQRKAYFEPFTELCGITVKEAEGPDLAKIKAMVDTGNVQWDLPEVGLDGIIALERQGDYWEPINYDLVDVDNIDEAFRHKNAIAMNPYGLIYAYRADAFSGTPNGWADFSDVEVPRPPRDGRWLRRPVAIPRGGCHGGWRGQRQDLSDGYRSGLRVTGEDQAARRQMVGCRRAASSDAGRQGGCPCSGLEWPDPDAAEAESEPAGRDRLESGGTRLRCLGHSEGRAEPENAQKLAAFSTLPISQARLSMLYPNGFVNNKSIDYIPKEIASTLATAPEHKEQLFFLDDNWWADNREEVLKRWNTFILG